MSGFSSFGSHEGALHGEFMGFVTDDASVAVLRNWVEKQGYPSATVQQSGPDTFVQMLEAGTIPKISIVDIDGQFDPAAAIARAASACGKEGRVIATGSANDISLFRKLIGAGAADYLVKPLSAEQVGQAVNAVLRGNIGVKTKDPKECRIIVFIGTRGGVGASTLALNVGWDLAHKMGQNAALLDLDLQFGTSSLALDLEPGRGLRDIVSSPSRVDSLMIASSIMPESEHFSVLATEESVDEFVPVDSAAITALIKEMKANFNTIVVDLPRSQFAVQKRLLAAAHEIVLVSDLSLAGIRDTLRIKSSIAALSCPARLSLVASRTNTDGEGQIDGSAFEKGVQMSIDATIAEDKASFATAANSGKALGEAAPKSEAAKAINELAKRLVLVENAAEGKKSFLSKFFGKFKEQD